MQYENADYIISLGLWASKPWMKGGRLLFCAIGFKRREAQSCKYLTIATAKTDLAVVSIRRPSMSRAQGRNEASGPLNDRFPFSFG
jgi:hypothetical protein